MSDFTVPVHFFSFDEEIIEPPCLCSFSCLLVVNDVFSSQWHPDLRITMSFLFVIKKKKKKKKKRAGRGEGDTFDGSI